MIDLSDDADAESAISLLMLMLNQQFLWLSDSEKAVSENFADSLKNKFADILGLFWQMLLRISADAESTISCWQCWLGIKDLSDNTDTNIKILLHNQEC